MKKLLSILAASMAALLMATAAFASDIGEKKGDVPKIEKGQIVIDGAKDEAYDNALVVDINQFLTGSQTGTYGKAYMLWADGEYYLLVEVVDADVCKPTDTSHADHPWTTDSVEIFYDFGNEHEDLVQQFRIDCDGYPSYYVEGGGYYAYGPEDAAEYFDQYAAQRTAQGYNIEMLVNLKDYNLGEGMSIGLQLQINDVVKSNLEATAAIYNMASSMNAGSWDADSYDYITLGNKDTKGSDTTGLATVETPVEVRGDFAFFDTYPEIKGEEVISVKSDLDDVSGYKGEINVNLHNLASGGNGYCPKMDTCVWYTFEAKESGMYTFLIEYVARNGAERGVDYSLDDPDGTKRVYIDLVETDEHGYVTGSFYAEKGTHDFYVYAPTGMDDTNLKSCDVYWVSVYSTPYLSGTANTAALIDADGYASYATKRPTVDGSIDDIWSTTESMYAFMYENDQWALSDLQDIDVATGYTKVLWTEDTLYLLAVIDDVTMDSDAKSTTNGINFWVSETFSGNTDFNSAPGDWHIFCNADGGTNYYTGNKDVYNQAEMAAARTDTGYIVEVAVPVLTEGFEYSADHKIGYNISVDDDADADNNRDTFTSWQAYDGRPYWENPSTLNEVALVGKTAGAEETPAEPADPNAPAILWDFNADGAMDANMGANSGANTLSWTADKDDAGNEYYTFTASGADPYVSVDLSAPDVSDVVWAKARVKNAGPATAIELFGHTNDRGLTGSECTHINVGTDGEWHTYIIYIPDENVTTVNAYKDPQYAITEPYWEGTVDWIRLDPMWQEGDDGNDAGGSMNDGDQIMIDYIAFFSSEEAAKAFRSELDSEYVASSGFASAEDAAAGKNVISGYEFVSGTEGFGGEGSENLWDGETSTKFCTNQFPAESIVKLDGTYNITGFTMATANDNADYNGRSPNAWTISVSADGENWTELAKGDDSFFEETNFTYYAGDASANGVSYVKFNAEGTASGTFQVSELTLFGDKAEEVTAPVDETLDQKAEAPNTFDFGITAAVAAVISLAGFAAAKKKH